MWGIKLTSEYISKLSQRFGTDAPIIRMCDGCGNHFKVVTLHPVENDELLCTECLYLLMCEGTNEPHPTLDEFKSMLKLMDEDI